MNRNIVSWCLDSSSIGAFSGALVFAVTMNTPMDSAHPRNKYGHGFRTTSGLSEPRARQPRDRQNGALGSNAMVTYRKKRSETSQMTMLPMANNGLEKTNCSNSCLLAKCW